MYKLLLTFRYLRRKLIPIFAMLAVTLCTAMVIIVISVMGGFLEMVRDAGKMLMGDVSITYGLSGFPHYEKLIEEIVSLDEAEAATPIIATYGLVKLPGGVIKPIQVYGIDGHGQERVTGYRNTLFWTKDRLEQYPDVKEAFGDADPQTAAMMMETPWGPDDPDQKMPPIVPGIEVSPFNQRDDEGQYYHDPIALPKTSLTVTILPLTSKGGISDPSVERFTVINEFHSGLYDVDSRRVYIPFKVAQKMMMMDPAEQVDMSVIPPKVIGTTPGRCTEVQIRATPDVTSMELLAKVEEVYDRIADQYPEIPPREYMMIQTWQQRQATFIAAVEHEKGLLTVLFGVISLVAVVMVAVIFYMIVLEKTRDIGILRSIGASRWGVGSIFLIYAAVIGALGSALGTGIAYMVVNNINEIHEWMGTSFGSSIFVVATLLVTFVVITILVLIVRIFVPSIKLKHAFIAGLILGVIGCGAAFMCLDYPIVDEETAKLLEGTNKPTTFGELLNENIRVVIWDRTVYFFDRIPNNMNWSEVFTIIAVAVVSSVLGSLIPAFIAGRVNPIESLRYE